MQIQSGRTVPLKVLSFERTAQTDLHPAVLEPDLDLSLREAQMVGDFNASPTSQIPVEVKFLHEGTETFLKYYLQPNFMYLLFSTLLHLPPLRFLCFEDAENEPRTVALAFRRSNHSAREYSAQNLKFALL